MATRTTADLVQGILGDQYDNVRGMDLSPFVATSSALIDWVVSNDSESILITTLAELVERWLAAHFYAHADQLLQSKSTGGASGSFQGQTGMVLSSTQYGQTAMALDVTGLLAQRSKEVETGTRNRAELFWLGLAPSEQTDVWDRD